MLRPILGVNFTVPLPLQRNRCGRDTGHVISQPLRIIHRICHRPDGNWTLIKRRVLTHSLGLVRPHPHAPIATPLQDRLLRQIDPAVRVRRGGQAITGFGDGDRVRKGAVGVGEFDGGHIAVQIGREGVVDFGVDEAGARGGRDGAVGEAGVDSGAVGGVVFVEAEGEFLGRGRGAAAVVAKVVGGGQDVGEGGVVAARGARGEFAIGVGGDLARYVEGTAVGVVLVVVACQVGGVDEAGFGVGVVVADAVLGGVGEVEEGDCNLGGLDGRLVRRGG